MADQEKQNSSPKSGSAAKQINIFVLGDVNVDVIKVSGFPAKNPQPLNAAAPRRPKQHRCIERLGGAWLVADTIHHDCNTVFVGAPPNVSCNFTKVTDTTLSEQIKRKFLPLRKLDLEAVVEVAAYPKKRGSKENETVYRIKDSLGWIDYREPQSGSDDKSEITKKRLRYIEESLGKTPTALRKSPALVILHDRNDGFRDADLTSFFKVQHLFPKPSNRAVDCLVLWELHPPLRANNAGWRLWRALDKPEFQKRLVAVVTSDALRAEGMRIRESASVETIVEEFLHEWDQLPAVLKKCRHLVVQDDQGFLYSTHDKSKITYHYCPYAFDGVASPSQFGKMAGFSTILVGALARSLCALLAENRNDVSEAVNAGLRLAARLNAMHFRNGFGDANEVDPNRQPFHELFDRYGRKPEDKDKSDREQVLASITLPRHYHSVRHWRRIHAIAKRGASATKDALNRIVWFGLDCAAQANSPAASAKRSSPWFPDADTECPYVESGLMRTFDRVEIDEHETIYNVIAKYLDSPTWRQPLSLCVFGPPGTGKGFTIKQILSTLDPEVVKNSLEFNLAQFSSTEDLRIAFHQVQDRTQSGICLVMFDEFDATLGSEKLAWLKYFLAPMEDAKFKSGESMYRIGRAIFVFAGGTAPSFKKFLSAKPKEFAYAKGPDFVSRLRAHLDIHGINPGKAGKPDAPLLFRRAVILRTLLEEVCPQIMEDTITTNVVAGKKHFKRAHIDPQVIRAFLFVPKYEHGVRSMKAILQMSKPARSFHSSNIPAPLQLELQVNAEAFTDFLRYP